MCNRVFKLAISTVSMVVFLLFSGLTLAQDASVVRGALAWNDWTKSDSGGSGTPAGVASKDYIRCKACHGWDGKGTLGGYARRSRQDGRPNAGFGDGDTTSRAITRGNITEAMIAHAGTGRSYAQGMGSWVALDSALPSAANTAAHANGYTLGNQHPDFSAGSATTQSVGGGSQIESLAAQQLTDLAAYLNFMDAGGDAYFDAVNTSFNPVLYTPKAGATAAAGEAFYNSTCFACHGDPTTDHQGANGGVPAGGLVAYSQSDGKFSELAHKMRWGVPDAIMTRGATGTPSSMDVANVVAYLQSLGGTGFPMTGGLGGAWQGGAAKDGEGFNVEIDKVAGGLNFTIFFFAFDSLGNQIYLTATGPITGNLADVEVFITEGGLWGAAFDPAAIARVPWGTGTFLADNCGLIHMSLTPNTAQQANGFTDLIYDLNRTTTPDLVCP